MFIAVGDLGDFKDLADDFLADLKGKYETLKSDVDDFKFPDFDDLRKYLPSEIDVDVDFDGTTIEEPPFPPHKDIDASKLSDDLIPFTDVNFGITTFVEPIPDGEVIVEPIPEGREIVEPIPEGREIVEPIPEGREIVEPIPPRFRTLPPPPGYHYHITVSASSPAPTTFATVTRSSGSARPSGYVYKGIWSVSIAMNDSFGGRNEEADGKKLLHFLIEEALWLIIYSAFFSEWVMKGRRILVIWSIGGVWWQVRAASWKRNLSFCFAFLFLYWFSSRPVILQS